MVGREGGKYPPSFWSPFPAWEKGGCFFVREFWRKSFLPLAANADMIKKKNWTLHGN